jgi:hypothetical protein
MAAKKLVSQGNSLLNPFIFALMRVQNGTHFRVKNVPTARARQYHPLRKSAIPLK